MNLLPGLVNKGLARRLTHRLTHRKPRRPRSRLPIRHHTPRRYRPTWPRSSALGRAWTPLSRPASWRWSRPSPVRKADSDELEGRQHARRLKCPTGGWRCWQRPWRDRRAALGRPQVARQTLAFLSIPTGPVGEIIAVASMTYVRLGGSVDANISFCSRELQHPIALPSSDPVLGFVGRHAARVRRVMPPRPRRVAPPVRGRSAWPSPACPGDSRTCEGPA